MRRMLAVVALSFAVVTGCGGVENDPNLAAAVERTEAEGTGKFEIRGEQKAEKQSAQYTCEGSADYAAERVRVDCEYAGMGDLDAIAIGDDYFFRGIVVGPTRDKWVKFSGEVDDETALSSLSPQKMLRLLRDGSTDTERLGETEIRGESSVGYTLTVDCKTALLNCESTVPVEVWIGDDGIVRRIAIVDDSGAATLEFFDFGVEVDIQAPPAEQVVEEDAVFAGSAGSAGSSSGPARCGEGEAKPISQKRTVSTLRRNGFSMRDDSQACFVSNATDGDATKVLEREGIVHCSIEAKPPANAPTSVTRRGADGADAELALENLTCTIFTDSPTGEEKIDKLEAAFAELERAIRP